MGGGKGLGTSQGGGQGHYRICTIFYSDLPKQYYFLFRPAQTATEKEIVENAIFFSVALFSFQLFYFFSARVGP